MIKKTIIALISTAAIMAIPCVSYASYSDLDEHSDCYEAASRLRDFGIMGGYEDGSFRPDKTITRAEVARLVTSALGANDKISEYVTDTASSEADGIISGDMPDYSFSDVPDTHWAHDYIWMLTAQGTLNGYGDGTFRPENEITYAEFIKILVNITGYTPYAEATGGYPQGYLSCAAILGITDGLIFLQQDNATRSDAAIMINNTLDVPILTVTGYDFSGPNPQPTYEVKNEAGGGYQTLLTKYHNIYAADITVDDNEK